MVLPPAVTMKSRARSISRKQPSRVDFRANYRVRTNQDALAALNAQIHIPYGDFLGDITLLPQRGTRGEGTIDRHGTDRERITIPGDDGPQNIANEFRCTRRNRRQHVEGCGYLVRYFDFVKMRERLIDRGVVLLHDGFATLSVGIRNCFFDGGDGCVAGQHTANRKETSLHDGVDACAHTGRTSHGVSVNHKKAQLLFDDGFLHLAGNVLPDFGGTKWRVQQERGTRLRGGQNIDTIQELKLVASHEVRFANQIGGANRVRAKAQMRNRNRAGFLRIVDEITLREVVRSLPDDFDGILVGADGSVRSESVEQLRARFVDLLSKILDRSSSWCG